MLKKIVFKFGGIVVLILMWQLAAVMIRLPMVSSPVTVAVTCVKIFPTLIEHGAASLVRVFLSMLISILIAVPIGIIAGYFTVADKIISPVTYIIYPIPKISLLPLAMLFFGLGNGSKICIMVLILMFQLIITIRDGVKNIPKEYFQPFYTAGASFGKLVTNIIFPATLPELFTGLRIGFATSLSVLFFSESYGTRYGMGYFILDAWMRVNYKQMYAGIVFLALIGILIYFKLDVLQKKICRGK